MSGIQWKLLRSSLAAIKLTPTWNSTSVSSWPRGACWQRALPANSAQVSWSQGSGGSSVPPKDPSLRQAQTHLQVTFQSDVLLCNDHLGTMVESGLAGEEQWREAHRNGDVRMMTSSFISHGMWSLGQKTSLGGDSIYLKLTGSKIGRMGAAGCCEQSPELGSEDCGSSLYVFIASSRHIHPSLDFCFLT